MGIELSVYKQTVEKSVFGRKIVAGSESLYCLAQVKNSAENTNIGVVDVNWCRKCLISTQKNPKIFVGHFLQTAQQLIGQGLAPGKVAQQHIGAGTVSRLKLTFFILRNSENPVVCVGLNVRAAKVGKESGEFRTLDLERETRAHTQDVCLGIVGIAL